MEKLSVLLLGEEQLKLQLRELEVEFVRNQKAILRQLQLCKKSGGLIGVYASVFGKGMFLTTVERIDFIGDEVMVIFKPHDLNGEVLQEVVNLTAISCICPFNQIYNEPVANEQMVH